jgi:hypothetical protein
MDSGESSTQRESMLRSVFPESMTVLASARASALAVPPMQVQPAAGAAAQRARGALPMQAGPVLAALPMEGGPVPAALPTQAEPAAVAVRATAALAATLRPAEAMQAATAAMRAATAAMRAATAAMAAVVMLPAIAAMAVAITNERIAWVGQPRERSIRGLDGTGAVRFLHMATRHSTQRRVWRASRLYCSAAE